ncbi:MAG TPA: transporter substrate-binding domain-containing protein [Dongiaceae bacterium]|nr:transporter substrate-binding domain-containing protein [Dongiaceae bacterium]
MARSGLRRWMAALGVVAGLGIAHAEAADKVRVGFSPEPYAPFWIQDTAGNWTGFEVELIDALFKQMGKDYELVPIAWDGLIPALQEKKIDAIMNSMSATAERKQVVDFSDKYYMTTVSFYGRKGDAFDYSEAGLKGKVVAVQTTTSQLSWLQQTWGKVVEIKLYDTQDNADADLAAGRVDYGLADTVYTAEGFLKSDAGKDYELKGKPIDDPLIGGDVGAAMRKGDPLLGDMNAAIKALRDNGTYKKINNKYFKFDVYGS